LLASLTGLKAGLSVNVYSVESSHFQSLLC
jgi:hypothetical protein